jgi:signal transduction histidine kinase
MVNDTSRVRFCRVDEKARHRTRSMLDSAAGLKRMIGVLCAVNKRAVCSEADIALPTLWPTSWPCPSNASILERSTLLQEVNRLNRAKDRVIHHLSHELKTPLSVLSASLNLLAKPLAKLNDDRRWGKTLDRAQRNLQRILDMQYKIEDMLQQKEEVTHRMMSVLLDQCADELEALAADEFGEESATERLRRRIDWIFGPRDSKSEKIDLARYADETLKSLRPEFAHRRVAVEFNPAETGPIVIPAEVLGKVIGGLLRNAVENTPDGGEVRVTVRAGKSGPVLEIRDTGGITAENQQLILGNFFGI